MWGMVYPAAGARRAGPGPPQDAGRAGPRAFAAWGGRRSRATKASRCFTHGTHKNERAVSNSYSYCTSQLQ